MSTGQNRNKCRFRIRYDNCEKIVETDSSEVSIGRDPDAMLRIDTVGVSRRHAVLSIINGIIHLEDQGSANGTYANGKELEPHKRVAFEGKETEFMLSEFVRVTVTYIGDRLNLVPEPLAVEIPSAAIISGPNEEWAQGLNADRKRLSERVESLKQELVLLKSEKIQLERDSTKEKNAVEAALLELKVKKIDLDKEFNQRDEEVKAALNSLEGKLKSATQEHEARLAALVTELASHKKSQLAAKAELTKRQEAAMQSAEELRIESERLEKHYRSNKELLAAQNAELKQEVSRSEQVLAELKAKQVRVKCETADLTEAAAKSVADAAEKARLAKEEQENILIETELLRTEASRLQEAIPDLRRSMNELRQEQTQLAEKVNEDKRNLDQEMDLHKELAEKRREELDLELAKLASELETTLKESRHQGELKELEDRKYSANLAALEAELRTKRSQVEAEIEEKRLELTKLRRELDAASQASSNGRKEANEAEQKISGLKAEMEGWQLQTNQLRSVKAQLEKVTEDSRAALAAIQAEKERIEAEARNLSEVARGELEGFRAEEETFILKERERRGKELEVEFSLKATEMEREVAEAKLKKMSELEKMAKEREEQERSRRQLLSREVVRRAVDLAQKGQLEDHELEFQQLIVDMLDGKSTGAWSLEAVYRTRKFWRKSAQAAAVPVAIIALLYFFPWIPLILVDNVNRKIASEKLENGAFYEQIKEKGMKYQPATDRVFRQTYSDNLLYLESYPDMKFDEVEKSKWILLLNDFLVGRLGLSDRVIPNFVSAESLMLKDLIKIREGMLPQYKENSLARMTEAEKKGHQALVSILQNEQNYAKFHSLEKSFYEDYIARKPRRSAP